MPHSLTCFFLFLLLSKIKKQTDQILSPGLIKPTKLVSDYTQKKGLASDEKSFDSVSSPSSVSSLCQEYIQVSYENIQRQICSVLPNCHRKPIVNVELVGCPRLCCCLCCVDQILLFLQLSMSFFWGGGGNAHNLRSQKKKKKGLTLARSLICVRCALIGGGGG